MVRNCLHVYLIYLVLYTFSHIILYLSHFDLCYQLFLFQGRSHRASSVFPPFKVSSGTARWPRRPTIRVTSAWRHRRHVTTANLRTRIIATVSAKTTITIAIITTIIICRRHHHLCLRLPLAVFRTTVKRLNKNWLVIIVNYICRACDAKWLPGWPCDTSSDTLGNSYCIGYSGQLQDALDKCRAFGATIRHSGQL